MLAPVESSHDEFVCSVGKSSISFDFWSFGVNAISEVHLRRLSQSSQATLRTEKTKNEFLNST